MAIETEKKFRLTAAQYGQIESSLGCLKADFVGEEFEINELYGGGILDVESALLRLRKINEKTILTYKKKIGNEAAIKQHTEFESAVSDSVAIENIIRALGFRLGLVYEKYRKTWRFNNVEVVLDRLPFGLFMEIEGRITDIALVEVLLEAEDFEVEEETYPKLTYRLGIDRSGVIEARFG
jgi:adenylate cyclase class 2